MVKPDRKALQSRRRFIRVTSAAAAAFFVPGSGFFACSDMTVNPQYTDFPTDYLTPLDRDESRGGFYIEFAEGKSWRPSAIDLSTWTLQFVWTQGGTVQDTARLAYSEIASLFAQEEENFTHTFQCVGNTPGGALVSTGVFTGVKLARFIEHFRKLDANKYQRINFRCYDGYSSNHTIDRIMADTPAPVYLVYKFNGFALSDRTDSSLAHGFPVRIVAPDFMGMKSPKALLEIEITDDDSVVGYWESRRIGKDYPDTTWADKPYTRVNSKIISPVNYQHVSGDRVRAIGFAWSGPNPVATVEVGVTANTDKNAFGVTWHNATIEAPPTQDMISVYGASQPEVIDAVQKLGTGAWPKPFVWTRWHVDIPLSSKQDFTLLARATDTAGDRQPFIEQGEAIADGNNGIHSIQVSAT
ncbi:MAG: molybdopterin-dependent oxidoreductase [Chitinivibrionales bacterium]|nr:molybdopterin-dependent oxidoreductase [Chitinivibrionales bacterium]